MGLFDEMDDDLKIRELKEGDATGSHFIRDGKLVADIRLEFNVEHPKCRIYIQKLQNLLADARKEPDLLRYSSGI